MGINKCYTRTRNTEHGTRNTEHGTRNTEHGTRNTEHGTRNTEHGTRNTEHGTRNTEHGTRNTEHGTRNTEHGTRDSIIGLIYDAALNPDLWQQVLDSLVYNTRSKTAVLLALDQLEPLYSFTFIHNIPAYALERYRNEHLDAADMALHGSELIKMGIGKAVQLYINYEAPEYEGTLVQKLYQRVFEPSGIYRLTGILFEYDRYHWTGLAVHRPKHSNPYTPEELDFLESLSVHIRRSLQIYRQFVLLQQQKQQIYAALDHVKFGVILLDHESSLIYANYKAKTILEKSKVLTLDPYNRLKTNNTDQVLLDRYILGALFQSPTLQQDLPVGGVLGLVEYEEQKPLMLTIVPISKLEHFGIRHIQGQKVAIFLSEPNQQHQLANSYLKQMYKLSKRELQICELFVNGMNLKEIAQHCGIAYQSVRSCLKSIFDKTECTSQTELMRLLMSVTVDFEHII